MQLSGILNGNYSAESKLIFIIIANHNIDLENIDMEILKKESSLSVKKIRTALRSADFDFMRDWADKLLKQKNKKIINSSDAKEVLDYLNKKANKGFRCVDANISFINARLQEGTNIEEMKRVIDMQVDKWYDNDMSQYLRPKTLFGKTNYWNYVGSLSGDINDSNESKEVSDEDVSMYIGTF